MTALTIPQGTTCAITASDVRIDGLLVDLTGWTVRGVIRQFGVAGPVVAEWSTTPSGSQGQATVGNGTAQLKITPAMSSPWTWSAGVVHAEATEPGADGRVARIIAKPIYLDPEAVV